MQFSNLLLFHFLSNKYNHPLPLPTTSPKYLSGCVFTGRFYRTQNKQSLLVVFKN